MITNKTLTKWRHAGSLISCLLIIVSIFSLATKGLNFGLDFTGGMISEVRLDNTLTAAQIQTNLEAALHQPVSVVSTGDDGQWMLRYAATEDIQQQPEIRQLLASFSDNVEMINVSLVGPQVGQELAEQGGLAVMITLMVILAYLSFRFEWRLASGALLALMHDVFILLGFFSLTGMEFNLTVLAALLAVLGYSLNDSIIISDRIRELLRANVKLPIAELNNQAILNTLSRTLITSGTTLISVASLWLLGGEPLFGFSITMFIGIVAGTWSTMTIATIIPELTHLGPQHYAPEPISEAP
ncbi:protein translocase subunit SecF [Vibrio scophthalmi]|uniref:Protein-export membrane protein SecF n=2 Tax=Vibrio scophthalmi TaxID=45658 RepID=F9RV77_9VIBR|nr:protein translocase subunit SecF [Vibrio scophthalmi]ANS87128.1 Protein translocase subunit SecF [Vibrio scophthalmi]ANU38857.1 Protein translocase subunit SecF [Vibrio scophthalmi]EGU29801.1 preprotein translocase subunit SecF [Vibrio scophthalmi LMG 19158]